MEYSFFRRVYMNSALEPVDKRGLQEGQEFVLQEDGDSGYDISQANPMRK